MKKLLILTVLFSAKLFADTSAIDAAKQTFYAKNREAGELAAQINAHAAMTKANPTAANVSKLQDLIATQKQLAVHHCHECVKNLQATLHHANNNGVHYSGPIFEGAQAA